MQSRTHLPFTALASTVKVTEPYSWDRSHVNVGGQRFSSSHAHFPNLAQPLLALKTAATIRESCEGVRF